jgi:hypothetical protein
MGALGSFGSDIDGFTLFFFGLYGGTHSGQNSNLDSAGFNLA